MTLDEFKKNRKSRIKKISCLSQYHDEIIDLVNSGFPQSEICDYLKTKGLSVDQSTVSKYLQRNSKKPLLKKEVLMKNQTKTNEVKKETSVVKKSIFEESNVESIDASIKPAKADFPELFD